MTGVLDMLPTVTIIGTWEPAATPDGTLTFTWYRPTLPADIPAKLGVVETPPMLTTTGEVVFTRGLAGVTLSGERSTLTGPRPRA